jgi:hypothetical protein
MTHSASHYGRRVYEVTHPYIARLGKHLRFPAKIVPQDLFRGGRLPSRPNEVCVSLVGRTAADLSDKRPSRLSEHVMDFIAKPPHAFSRIAAFRQNGLPSRPSRAQQQTCSIKAGRFCSDFSCRHSRSQSLTKEVTFNTIFSRGLNAAS